MHADHLSRWAHLQKSAGNLAATSAGMLAVFLGFAFCLGGCVRHEITVTAAPAPANLRGIGASAGTTPLAFTRGATSGGATTAAWREVSTFPIALPVQMWWRDDRGRLHRTVAEPQTSTPWWQRFPCDLFTDLTPWDQPIVSAYQLRPQPLLTISAATMAATAREAGYADP